MRRLPVLASFAAFGLVCSFGASPRQNALASAFATPPPPPPALPSAAPSPTPTPIGVPGPTSNPPAVTVPIGASPSATPTPVKDKDRVGISGVWEIQIQRPSGTSYAHFKLAQNGNTLTGVYLDGDNKRFPLAGTFNAATKTVRIIVSFRDGSTMTFEGTEDNATDMIGDLTSAKDSAVAFTAAYRPKYEFLDNINATPGGLGP